MWIERLNKKTKFLQSVTSLQSQVLLVRGARQVGKTSFIINGLKELANYPQIRLNLAFPKEQVVEGVSYYGRDYFGFSEGAEELLNNLSLSFGEVKNWQRPVIVFIDEADRHPVSLESVQKLAGLSEKLKVIYTGSNLENITVKNAATGRKKYFDLYPITFSEFLKAYEKEAELKYLSGISVKKMRSSQHYHHALTQLFALYLRLGGMPKVLDTFLDPAHSRETIPHVVSDLTTSIEENIKIVLGEKAKLYEYEDVLRKLALSSLDTLKFSRLQVQHASRPEVKKLVNKTVGARVAHKIRLLDVESDLSKYILFDAGVLNYLLNGSDLLQQKITTEHLAIQYETSAGNEIIAALPAREDLFYWKSKRGAQVEYLLRSPLFAAIDVKTSRGDVRSLDSCAIYEKDLDVIIRVSQQNIFLNRNHLAKIPNPINSRRIPFLNIPHYLCGRLKEICGELKF